MKRFLLLALLLVSLFLVGCGETEVFEPSITLGEGFTLEKSTISGTVVGEEYYPLFAVFDTAEKFVIFGDRTAETFLESGVIPLKKGENHFIIRFMRDGAEREYELRIRYVPIRSFRVELIDPDRTYHIGERFEPETIRVIAVTDGNGEIEVKNYRAEYEFSELGVCDVGIELGGMYHSVEVTVAREYLPTLDGSFSADGVHYALSEDSAVLIRAQETEGFFAVPRAVYHDGREYPVLTVGDGAFSCSAVTGVAIAEGVQKIASGAFSECEALEWIELPESLTSIGRQAFSGCISLGRIVLPDGITEIANGTFYGCRSLYGVTLPENLRRIGDRAFFGCEGLKQFQAPRALGEIGVSAFEGCKALARVTLGDLSLIGNHAFASCEALTSFALARAQTLGESILDGTNTVVYTVADGAVMQYAKTAGLKTVTVQEGKVCLVSLPDRVEIGEDYPYGEVVGFVLDDGGIREVSNYTVSYPLDASGPLAAVFTFGDFSYGFMIFVEYTETVLVDTDTRGARYALDPATMTATLVSCPEYLRPSRVYVPEDPECFIVPTALCCPDGIYTVAAVAEGAFDGCLNVTSVWMPQSSS